MARSGRGYPNKPIVVRSFVAPVTPPSEPGVSAIILKQTGIRRNRPGVFITTPQASRNFGSAFPPTPDIITIHHARQRAQRRKQQPNKIIVVRPFPSPTAIFASTPNAKVITPSKNTHQKSKYAPNDIIYIRAPRVTQTTVFATTPNAKVIPDRTRRDELRRKKFNRIVTAFPQGPGSPLPIPVIGTAIPKLGRHTGLRAEAEII